MPKSTKYQEVFIALLIWWILLTTIGGMDIRLRCSDYIEKVHVQDKDESDRSGWRETVQLSVSDKASIIAVQWSNVGGTTPALIASASTGIVSDDINWKCTTTQPEDNWYEEHYDSRGWENAAVVCRNDNCGSRSDSSFPGNASWIRSAGGSLAGQTYCRGQLGPVSLTAVYPRSDIAGLYTDGVTVFFRRNKGENITTQKLTHTPQLIAVRHRRPAGLPGWILVSLSNGFISGEDWKCVPWSRPLNDTLEMFQYLDFDDTSWDPAVVVPPITSDYKVIDNNAKIWWRPQNDENEQDCFCRGTVGVSAYVYCKDQGYVYVDGLKMSEQRIHDEWRSIIPRTARLIAIEASNARGQGLVRAIFSNGFQTSEGWKCSTVYYDNWNTIQFDDSTVDWKAAKRKTSDSLDYIWEESDEDGTIYCRGLIECGCGPNFKCIPSIDRYNYKCVCREGYSGETCEDTAVKCSDRPAVCGDHGRCVDIDDFYVCLCDDGYAGEQCDIDINECASNPCQHDTACVNTIGSFHCDCTGTGYEGQVCDKEIIECRSDPCQNDGTCTDGFKSFTCNCSNTGFEGSTCSIEINECESNPCQNSGKCEDKINHFKCHCTGTGYEGPTCSSDVDDCLQTLPQCVDGTCINFFGSYRCTCVSGYTGLRCETDIDECANSKLNDCAGKCSNYPGGYNCVDIDECTGSSQTTITGLIAAIVVFNIVIVVVVAVVVFIYRRRGVASNENRRNKQEFSEQTITSPEELGMKQLTSEDLESPYSEADEHKVHAQPQSRQIGQENTEISYETLTSPNQGEHTYENTKRE